MPSHIGWMLLFTRMRGQLSSPSTNRTRHGSSVSPRQQSGCDAFRADGCVPCEAHVFRGTHGEDCSKLGGYKPLLFVGQLMIKRQKNAFVLGTFAREQRRNSAPRLDLIGGFSMRTHDSTARGDSPVQKGLHDRFLTGTCGEPVHRNSANCCAPIPVRPEDADSGHRRGGNDIPQPFPGGDLRTREDASIVPVRSQPEHRSSGS